MTGQKKKQERKVAVSERVIIGIISFCIVFLMEFYGKHRAVVMDPFKLIWFWGMLIVMTNLSLQIWRNKKTE